MKLLSFPSSLHYRRHPERSEGPLYLVVACIGCCLFLQCRLGHRTMRAKNKQKRNTGVLHFVQDDGTKEWLLLFVFMVVRFGWKGFAGVGFFGESGLVGVGGTEGLEDAAGVVAAAHGHAAGAGDLE